MVFINRRERGLRSLGWRGTGALACALALVSCSTSGSKPEDSATSNRQRLGFSPALWPSEGPAPISESGYVNTLPAPFDSDATGAVERILIDPAVPTGAYVASINGGVFKTANYTTILSGTLPTWTAQTDQLPSLSMGDIAIDPTNNQRLVAATGCVTSGALCGASGLLYVSPNGGSSWSVTNDPLLSGQVIQGVTVRGQTILAGTGSWSATGGIYRRTLDAGTFQSLAGVGGLPASFGAVYDLIADPTDANRYYAVIASNGSGNDGGLYRTSDAGTTWVRVSNNDTNAKGLNFMLGQYLPPIPPATWPPQSYVSNARLAIGPTGKLYVVVALLGQAIYIAENGAVSYTPPHSGNKGKNPIVGGWYSKKMKSNCANPVTVVDWIEPGPKDRTRTGGLVMCPVKFPNSTAKYKLYANTRAFDQKDCKAIVGIQEVANEASFGAWAYW